MSYNPVTDFLGLLRTSGSAVALARMPGLDFLLAAMERAGIIQLWEGQSPPTANVLTTVWIKPAQPSWTAEGTVYLYDAAVGDFMPATPELWAERLSSPTESVFQSVVSASDTVAGNTTLLAVRRTVLVPTVTSLLLPAIAVRNGLPLQVVDWSSVTSEHQVILTTPDGASIMRQPSWSVYSTPYQLAGLTLRPSSNLDGWVIAP